MENEAPLPRPIDNGQVDQTVVEYTGPRLGTVTYRRPSGREYRFDASPRDKRKYVLAEDLDYFRRPVEAVVVGEGQGLVPQLPSTQHQLLDGGCAVQKRPMGVAV